MLQLQHGLTKPWKWKKSHESPRFFFLDTAICVVLHNLCIGIEIIISTCFEKWGMVKVVIYFEALFVPITFIGMVIVHAEIEEQIGALGSTVWHNKWLWSGSMDCLSFFRKESSLPSSAQCHYFLHDMRVPSKKFFLTSSRLGGELLASLRSLLVG
jgi:hypothetical protein